MCLASTTSCTVRTCLKASGCSRFPTIGFMRTTRARVGEFGVAQPPVWSQSGSGLIAALPTTTETRLKEHVKKTVGMWKYPRWIEVVDGLPKTATGKIQRFKLREQESKPA